MFSNPTASKGKLIEYIMHCQKKGFSDATTRTKSKILRVMTNNNVNLNDPEAVKLFIAKRQSWSNGHKQIAVYAYDEYAKMEKIEWQAPFYHNNQTLPFIPIARARAHTSNARDNA